MPYENTSAERYAARELLKFATALLTQSGLEGEKAAVVAEILLEADLMGHTTHGLSLLPPYLQQIESGTMALDGEPKVIMDGGANIVWDGCYLPGTWLVVRAMNKAFERIKQHPVVTVAIQRSQHIACLAAFPKRATDRGLMMLLASSDPFSKSVAPYGGVQPLYTPNPLAAGIPTSGDPIIIDISMSTTANGTIGQYRAAGERLPGKWLLDNQGNATDDPESAYTDPPGTVLPLGGVELGYKGFALGILVEALTSALAGYGRADEPTHWGASVFVQIINPDAFGGADNFIQETDWLADACRNSVPIPGGAPVRMPGSHALKMRAEQMENGVLLYQTILTGAASLRRKVIS